MDAYKGDFSLFCPALHVSSYQAFGKGEYSVRRLYAIYLMGIVLYFLHDGFWHGNSADAVIGLGRCHNIAACLVLQGFSNMYGIFLKVEVGQREGKEFAEAHTGIKKKLQSGVCA